MKRRGERCWLQTERPWSWATGEADDLAGLWDDILRQQRTPYHSFDSMDTFSRDRGLADALLSFLPTFSFFNEPRSGFIPRTRGEKEEFAAAVAKTVAHLACHLARALWGTGANRNALPRPLLGKIDRLGCSVSPSACLRNSKDSPGHSR